MNQDLDDRLIPKGEYRIGQNVTISRSEGDDVGTFQNILGKTFSCKYHLSSFFWQLFQVLGRLGLPQIVLETGRKISCKYRVSFSDSFFKSWGV